MTFHTAKRYSGEVEEPETPRIHGCQPKAGGTKARIAERFWLRFLSGNQTWEAISALKQKVSSVKTILEDLMRVMKNTKNEVTVSQEAVRSKEWERLSAGAKILYFRLKANLGGRQGGAIRLRYADLRDVRGLKSPSTVANSFKELRRKGWIRVRHVGGLVRYANEYELTGKYDQPVRKAITLRRDVSKRAREEAESRNRLRRVLRQFRAKGENIA